jgi:hypothetical protein
MAESQEFIKLLDDIRDLHKRKNDGYAGKDAEDPWANFRMAEMLGISAFQGCLVRMSDKFIRVCNLSKDPTNEQVGEAITDTLMDLAVYSLIAICLRKEQNYDENNAKFEGILKNPPKTIIDQDAFQDVHISTVGDIEHAHLSFHEAMDRYHTVNEKLDPKRVKSSLTPEEMDTLLHFVKILEHHNIFDLEMALEEARGSSD